jgi:hypothetical protein
MFGSFMKKTGTILVLVGGLLTAGIILSFYGSQVITEDLVQVDGSISNGESLETVAELDPEINNVGVYVVQTMNFNQGDISVKIFDPSGSQIISKTVEIESFEEQFDISTKGDFRLIIENAGDSTEVIGVIGHLPDTAKFSIGVTGFYLLVVGLFGMVGLGIYVAKNRRKN